VAERLALAEIEAALARLAAGRFGWCEQCAAAITIARLAEVPQARYCQACERQQAAAGAATWPGHRQPSMTADRPSAHDYA
jgi:RNA polymerase-binding transcription factor DksA